MSYTVNLSYDGRLLPMSAAPKAWFGSTTALSLAGTAGNDQLAGNGKAETLQGGLGDDTYIIYRAEKVVEQPGQGTDTIQSYYTNILLPDNVENLYVHGSYYGYGNSEANVIVGDAGNQVLDGGQGDDVLTGGGGQDTFVFDALSGHDVVTDFTPGAGSVVRLAGYSQFTNFSEVRDDMSQHGADVVLSLDATDSITFRNTTISQFSQSDFLLGLDPSSKQQTFSENFNSLNLGSGSSNAWLPYYSFVSNTNSLADRNLTHGEQEIYVDPGMSGQGSKPLGLNPFSISGGILTITEAATPTNDLQALYGEKYTSGVLTTHNSFSQEYGYFEIDAKLPTAPGTWPAFWLVPTSGQWPPEIDVMESYGGGGVVDQAIHTGVSNTISMVNTNLVNAATDFHTYSVLWDPQHVTFYIDHVETAQYTTPADMHQAMYMILNLAATPSAPASSFPASMEVDYVHAFSLADAPTDVVASAAAASAASIGTVSPHTYTVGSAASATVSKPFVISSINPGLGDMIDLSGLDSNPSTRAVDAFKLVSTFDGHAGELELVRADHSGGWELLGDLTGSGHASLEVTFHVNGSLSSYADIASHIIL